MVRRFLSAVGLLGPARLGKEIWIALKAWPRNRRVRRVQPPDSLEVPPARLIYRVAGTPELDWFLEGGAKAARSIDDALERAGMDRNQARSVLDFGCGCGRVLRHWRHRTGWAISGCDVREELVEWCARYLPFAAVVVNQLDPPLAYANCSFDIVYALSVFTHLDEERQKTWIRELARVLVPGGHLIITTHGDRYVMRLPPTLQARYAAGALVVEHAEDVGRNVCGAYHPERYVRETLAAGWDVIQFSAEGAEGNPHQDLWLLRKPREG